MQLMTVGSSKAFSAGSRLQECLTVVALVAFLTGCTTGSRATTDSFRLLVNQQAKATMEQVAANPYPQLQLKATDLSAVAVLAYVDQGNLAWFASNQAVFYTDIRGLLLSTTGLGRSYHSKIVGASPFENLNALTGTTKVSRKYDWLPGYQFDAEVTGTLTRLNNESVDLLGRRISLTRFEEHLTGSGMNETNVYWVDPATGTILKSRQYLAPGYKVELQYLKPYRPSTN